MNNSMKITKKLQFASCIREMAIATVTHSTVTTTLMSHVNVSQANFLQTEKNLKNNTPMEIHFDNST